MNIALVGYGRMGHEVERIACERGHVIQDRYTSANPLPSETSRLANIDCCIDFSSAKTVPDHVLFLSMSHIPLIEGTTGWYGELSDVKRIVEENNGAMVYASNFSVGANLFYRVISAVAEMVDRFPDYDIAIHETHHRLKKDFPSGTALNLAEKIIEQVSRKTKITTSLQSHSPEPEEIHIASSRIGTVTGIHTVIFNSAADSIELKHSAHNRNGFALGALLAAEWIQGRSGVFTFEDVMHSL